MARNSFLLNESAEAPVGQPAPGAFLDGKEPGRYDDFKEQKEQERKPK
jgi:hypothetical protein